MEECENIFETVFIYLKHAVERFVGGVPGIWMLKNLGKLGSNFVRREYTVDVAGFRRASRHVTKLCGFFILSKSDAALGLDCFDSDGTVGIVP